MPMPGVLNPLASFSQEINENIAFPILVRYGGAGSGIDSETRGAGLKSLSHSGPRCPHQSSLLQFHALQPHQWETSEPFKVPPPRTSSAAASKLGIEAAEGIARHH
jgi:hypothetical protein